MSVEKVERKGGAVWRVRWREGGRERSRVVGRKRDAEALDAELRRRRRLGTLGPLDAGSDTLSNFAVSWWRLHARPKLAPSTQRRYAEVFDVHLLPRLGGYRLRELSPAVVDDFRAALEAQAGAATVAKALTVLSSILSLAVLRGELERNPVSAVRKPRSGTSRRVEPPAPEQVEALRAHLSPRDATLVSVLAYAGLRPSEALALRWGAVRERTLLIEAGVVLGERRDTKTRRARTVRLLAPLAGDLREWRLASGRPDERALVFPRPDGQPWRDGDFRNWRKRVYRPAARAVGIEALRPYDLRHAFVSLLISEGGNVVEVARQAGHSAGVCLSTYAHSFEEFDPSERIAAEERIRRARAKLVSVTCPARGGAPAIPPRNPL